MKKIYLPVLFGILLMVLVQSSTSAQSEIGWEPIMVTVSGGNNLDGVEAYYKLGECEGEKVVFIGLYNTNSYSVQVSWYNAVFKQDLKWVNNEEASSRANAIIGPGVSVKGECVPGTALMVFLKDYISSVTEFNKFGVTEFTVISL